jgi:hypothetical protein
MRECTQACCRGHALPPLSRAYLRSLLQSPEHRHLRKIVDKADDLKGFSNDVIERAASVYAKLLADDKFRCSAVGRALFGGNTLSLGPDPLQYVEDANPKAIRYTCVTYVYSTYSTDSTDST